MMVVFIVWNVTWVLGDHELSHGWKPLKNPRMERGEWMATPWLHCFEQLEDQHKIGYGSIPIDIFLMG